MQYPPIKVSSREAINREVELWKCDTSVSETPRSRRLAHEIRTAGASSLRFPYISDGMHFVRSHTYPGARWVLAEFIWVQFGRIYTYIYISGSISTSVLPRSCVLASIHLALASDVLRPNNQHFLRTCCRSIVQLSLLLAQLNFHDGLVRDTHAGVIDAGLSRISLQIL